MRSTHAGKAANSAAVADLYLGGGRKRRSSGADGFILALALVVVVLTYLRFAPRSAGAWDTAAGQVAKKLPSIIFFYPAWQRQVLHELQDAPVIMLEGREHFALAGLGHVLFASEEAAPEQVIDNLFVVSELRDFAGKAMQELTVADASLETDFAQLSVITEDPPGIANCLKQGAEYHCPAGALSVQRRSFRGRPAVCVEAHGDEPLSIVWARTNAVTLRHAQIYLGVPDGAPSEAQLDARVEGRVVGHLAAPAPGHWVHAPLRLSDSRRVELTVTARTPVCVDLEVMP